jgi:hypothetical protein
MPSRPRSHILEDQARAQLIKLFSNAGWSVEQLDEDYGEDFLVRIFDNEKSTPWSFFVQSKSTDNITKFKILNRSAFSYPLKVKHLFHWQHFSAPVLITLTDVKSGNVYWECVQTYLEDIDLQVTGSLNSQTTVRIRIPTDNTLDADGIRRIKRRTKARFSRLSKERIRVQQLTEYLKSNMGIDIAYDHDSDVVILPRGKFIPEPSGEHTVLAFGNIHELLEELMESLALNSDKIVDHIVHDFKRRLDSGEFEPPWKSPDEAKQYLRHMREAEED